MKYPALAVLLLAGCHAFLDIDARRCGNRVHEPSANEDCDRPIGKYGCGAPGTANACRLLCAEVDGSCPDGWACGVDGVCRVASGRLEAAHIAPIEGDVMEISDLDGDGLSDLVVQDRTTLRYAYGDIDGVFGTERTLSVPSTNIPIAVGDTNGDAYADVAQLFVDGLQIFQGSADRVLIPVSAVDAPAPEPPERMYPIMTRAPFSVVNLLTTRTVGGGTVFGVFDGTLDASALMSDGILATWVAIADLDGADARSEDEIVLGFLGAPHVDVVRVRCDPRVQDTPSTCALEVVQTLPLPEGTRVGANGTHLGDLDADGQLDLLVGTAEANVPAIAVAYGSADGFGPLELDPRLAAAAGCAGCEGVQVGLRQLTAVAHINSPRASLATGFQISDLTDDGALVQLYFPRRPLGRIQFADLNGDGIQDAYGNLAGALVYLLANADRQFTHHDTQITGYQHVAPGDFDGDGRLDLAVALASGEIRVVFSEFDGPQESVLVARLEPPIVSLQRARLLTPQHRQLDGADELIVYTGDRRYVFQGSAERRPWAPVRLPEFPRELAIGNFGAGAPGIYVSFSFRLAQQNQVLFGEDLSLETFQPITVNNCGQASSATEVINRTLDYGGEKNAVLTIEVQDPSQAVQVRRARILVVQGGIGRCVFNVTLTDTGRPHAVAFADLDQDGTRDMVLSTGAEAQANLQLGPPGLVLWRGDGERFDEAYVNLPHPFEQPAIAALRLGDAPQPTIIGVEAGNLVAVTLEDGALVTRPIARAPVGARHMRAGDVDGDGVEDLIVKTQSSVFVYRQLPCTASETVAEGCTRPPIR